MTSSGFIEIIFILSLLYYLHIPSRARFTWSINKFLDSSVSDPGVCIKVRRRNSTNSLSATTGAVRLLSEPSRLLFSDINELRHEFALNFTPETKSGLEIIQIWTDFNSFTIKRSSKIKSEIQISKLKYIISNKRTWVII